MDSFSAKASQMEDSSKIAQLQEEIGRLKSAMEELTILNDLAIAASTSLEVDQMLDIIVEKSIKSLKAEQGSILLTTEQEEAPLKTLIRQADRHSRMMTYKVGINITGWVLKYQQPLLIENLATDTRFQTTEQERKEIKSVLCVPIRFKSQLLGLLMVTNKRIPDSFTASDIRLLSIIAAQSGQLIRNSQLQAEALEKKRMEHELRLARDIQLRLLPKNLPATKRLDIAAYFNPADEVGGDYYDYFQIGEEQIGVVLADVSGHGTSSALVMTMVKGVLHSLTKKFETPHQLLGELNAILSRIAPREMFVTMVFLLFDTQKKTLRYSNAGHNPLLFYNNATTSCQMVELAGPALGISNAAVFQEKEMVLQTGDLLLIYTDGVTEAFNEHGKMFGEEGLIQAVATTSLQSAGKIIEHARNKLIEFRGGAAQSDDVAMITLKVL